MMGKLRKQLRTILSMGEGSDLLGILYHRVILFPSAPRFLIKELRDCDSVLDLGCGENSMLRFIPAPNWTVGVDAWGTCVRTSRGRNIHHDYIMADITKLQLAEKSVDAIMLMEVLEHLTKEEGLSLLDKMKRIARKRIILTTPNGYLPQDNPDNPFQKHKSGWEIDELQKMGFTDFRGVGGLRVFGWDFDRLSVALLVQSLPQKIAYRLPRKANGFICKLELDGTKSADREGIE